MAYMNQEKKRALAPKIKEILKRHGVKGTLSVNNLSTLVLTISASHIDFLVDYPARGHLSVNTFWYQDHFTGEALEFLKEVIPAMKIGNHDRSDIDSDYFDVGWYIDVNIGSWNKPYTLLELA